MKKLLISLFLAAAFITGPVFNSSAQSIKLLGSNTLNGAINGVLLGGATMALKNSEDLAPVRVGLGGGTLYGIGIGIYDITQVDAGQQFYISGTFNDGTNSSVIVLLDTIYGAAGGAIIASSIALVGQNPLLDALQYGSGVGAWAGFGFGLIDTFVFATGPNYGQQTSISQQDVGGLITYSNKSESLQVGMLKPDMIEQKTMNSQSVTVTHRPAINIVQLQLGF
ncbi:hypothetical protein [Fodinibius salinus]|uniref:hypothetical protein n=1 Tax=Fodinibius salinus TaxID=860790 RepID=UPI0011E6C977|nr:hypothetical protein [Fodinibius salinus]